MAKTVVFGIMHVVTSFTVTYALTGSLTLAGVVTFVEPLVNTVMHYFFDKYWDHPWAEAARQAMTPPSLRANTNKSPGSMQATGA